MFITGAVSTTPAISCSPVSTTPAINPFHGFSVIALILFTDFQWSPVSLIPAVNLLSLTMTPGINLLPVTTTSVIKVCGVSMNTSFHGGSNETIGGRVQLRRSELLPFWFEIVVAASGSSNQGVYGCIFSWWLQWHHWRPRPTPAAGDIAVLLSALSFRRCRWHQRTIFRRCRWHRR